jgi:hypothetical protein
MGPPCLLLPVIQCAFAGIVGIVQGPECLLGSLDGSTVIIVVHDHPDELLSLQLRRGDHEAVDRSGGLGFRLHFRNMTAALTFDKRLVR